MDHSYYIDKLSAYSDRELTGEEHEVVRRHVESCPECQAALVEYEKLDHLVEDNQVLGNSDYWEAAAERIDARLSSETDRKVIDVSKQRTGWLGWKLASVAATIAVLTFVALNREDIEMKLAPMSKPSLQESPTDLAGKKSENALTGSERRMSMSEAPTGKPDNDMDQAEIVLTEDDRSQAAAVPVDELGRARLQAGSLRSAPPVVGKPSPKGGDAGVEPMVVGEGRLESDKDLIRLEKGNSESTQITFTKVTRPSAAAMDRLRITGTAQLTDSALIIAESVAQTSQEYWHQRRDSLEGDLRARYYSRAENEKAARSMSLKSAGFDPVPFLHSVALLKAYYRIGYLTEDREEFERSMEYIRQYVKQPELPYRSKAAGWLEELQGLESVKWGDER